MFEKNSEEINLDLIFIKLVHKWKIILGIAFASALVGYVVAINLPVKYKSSALLISQKMSSDSVNIASGLGGLASLAGVNVSGGVSSTDMIVAVLKSRDFNYRFIEAYSLKQDLFLDKLSLDGSKWIDEEPSIEQAFLKFDAIRSISVNPKSGLVTLEIEWVDRFKAAEWVNKIVEYLNGYQKKVAVKESMEAIQFLQKELDNTSVVAVQKAIFNLIESQTKNIMLANVKEEYALKMIDRAIVPEVYQKSSPNVRVITLLFALFGAIFSVVFCLVNYRN